MLRNPVNASRCPRSTWRRRALAIVLGLCVAVPGLASDGDGDGLDDAWEGAYFGNLKQTAAGDPDGDGLTNQEEVAAETDPTKPDTDGDSLTDAQELKPKLGMPVTDPTKADSDGDFLPDGDEELKYKTNPLAKDSDGDQLPDNVELQVTKSNPLQVDTDNGFSDDGVEVLIDHTDPTNPADDKQDSDSDGLPDWQETNVYKTDRLANDSDGDGLPDGEEVKQYKTNPANPDTDGDGLKDGAEVAAKTNPLKFDTDDDGLNDGEEVLSWKTDPLLPDTDWDSLSDADEVLKYNTSALKPDSDGGGIFDPVEVADGTSPNDSADDKGKDKDGDGLSDGYELVVSKTSPTDADGDGDGLTDGQEVLPLKDHLVTNPNDADSDDDGLLDGAEGGVLNFGKIEFGTSPIAFDTDSDGLGDGQEQGLTKAQVSAKQPVATNSPPFLADSDPASKTDARNGDSDGDGLKDGDEDKNHNGKWDKPLGETDATKPDTDGDGLGDAWEVLYSTSVGQGPPLKPLDPADGNLDNDGDGLTNLQEYNVLKPDKDGKGVANRTNPRAADSDGDGLSDKIEWLGKYLGTAPFQGTDPNVADTDGDKVGDGAEDKNKNGATETSESNPKVIDSDGDGLEDGQEDANHNGKWDKVIGPGGAPAETDPANPDSDGDGLSDGLEVTFYGTNPLAIDTDADALPDGQETGKKGDADTQSTTDPKVADSDGDGLGDGAEDVNKNGKLDAGETDPNKADTDGDGLGDGLEIGKAGDADPATTSNPLNKDTDGDGLFDGTEDKNRTGKADAGETDPNLKDTDGGGTADGQEVLFDATNPLDPSDDAAGDADGDGLKNNIEVQLGTSPKNPDTDGDTISDGAETNGGKPVDTDGDGTLDVLDADSDGDGWSDAQEAGDSDWKTKPLDTNGDGIADYRALDADGDGLTDTQEQQFKTDRIKSDTDGDGLGDGLEVKLHTNPLDRDSDDDGLLDGEELTTDGDGDGLANALDPDSDNDGLFDGTELGRTVSTLDAHTDLQARNFISDADVGSKTNPNNADSDSDGRRDGAEDTNHDGKLGSGESDATVPTTAPALLDSDKDGLPDAEEAFLQTNSHDADSDDDGVPDGAEWNMACDTDRDGAVNAADPDGDDDGLADGLERGAGQATVSTELAVRNFMADLDSTATTSPLVRDSDGDGQRDGLEDLDGNGRVDAGEGDPNDAKSQTLVLPDADNDGLADPEEMRCGSDPQDPDSDDDGLADGKEANATVDYDGDGLPGALDPDSDNDGVGDGTERGVTQAVAGNIENALGNFHVDVQPQSRTFPCSADSDGDGQRDGWEDANHDGAIDSGESDPLVPESVTSSADKDGDGLSDVEEQALGSHPDDADSDDDGVGDRAEANFAFDTDGDGQINALDEDSDGDQLFDGTERGLTLESLPFPQATDLGGSVFVADKDPGSRTFAVVADSDRGGMPDGAEDFSRDGRLDPGETDPSNPKDDGTIDGDIDGDGIENTLEIKIGTSPMSADTDGDGLLDPTEVTDLSHPADTDGDGKIDALDLDSDNDSVPDQIEARLDPDAPPGAQVPADSDGDGAADFRDTDSDNDGLTDGDEVGKWHTDPTQMDTDHGGLRDDVEVLQTHTNPNDPSDDQEVLEPGGAIRGTTPLSCGAAARADPAGMWLLALLAALILGVRRRGSLVVLLLATVLLHAGMPSVAQALTPPDVTGLRINLDGQGLLGVDAARQIDLGSPTFGVQMQWAYRPLVVGTELKVIRPLVNYRLEAGLGGAWRVWKDLTLGAYLPVALAQDGSLPSRYGPLSGPLQSSSVGDLVLAAKWVFRADRVGAWGFAAVLPVSLPTGEPLAYAGRPGPTFTPTAIGSTQIGPWRLAVNAGVRIQSEHTAFNVTDGPALRVGVAGSLNPTVIRGNWKHRWRPEGMWIDASLTHETPLLRPLSNRNEERLEAGLAVNLEIANDFFLMAGSTFGLWPGFGVPAYRPMVMLRYGEPPRVDVAGMAGKAAPVALSLDRDGDHIADAKDRCPEDPEDHDAFEDEDGCPDADDDGDGILDAKDVCRLQAEDKDGYQDDDGCPDLDDDGDGVADAADRCPRVAEDKDGVQDDDGCPDLDDDGDGIADADDRCPTVAENWNGVDDSDGCPEDGAVALDERAGTLEIAETVYFASLHARVLRRSWPLLDAVARFLLSHPQIGPLQVAGHTDERGSDKLNQQLSAQRAHSVRRELVRRGVAADRLQAVGFGKDRPIATGQDDSARAANRRVEFRIIRALRAAGPGGTDRP